MSSTMVTDLCCASRPPRDLWLSNRHLGAAFPPDLNGEYSVVLEEVEYRPCACRFCARPGETVGPPCPPPIVTS